MMHDNFWGMGWGVWIIPVAIVLIVVFILRYKRKGWIKTTLSNAKSVAIGFAVGITLTLVEGLKWYVQLLWLLLVRRKYKIL